MTGQPLPVWARRRGEGWTLAVRAQPGASASEVVGRHGEELRVRVRGRAVEGRANAELERFLAERLGVPPRAVQVVRGGASRSKVVAVEAGVSAGALRALDRGER